MEMERKYSKLAYILCAFFLGGFGVHAFIAGKPIQGVLFIIFTLLGLLLSFIGVGFIIFIIQFIIIIVQIIIAAGKPADQYGQIK